MLWCDMILDSGRGHVCCVAFVFSDPLRRLSLIRLKHSFAHTADEAANAVAQITAEKQSGGRESVSWRYRMERPRCQQRPRALRRHIQWRQSGNIARQSRRKSRPGQPGETGDLQGRVRMGAQNEAKWSERQFMGRHGPDFPILYI